MTPEEHAVHIKKVHDEAVLKLNDLKEKGQDIINQYIKELEVKKIEALKSELKS